MRSGAWVPPDMMSCIQVKEFNFCFIRAENFISHCLGVLQVTSGKLQVGCHEPFTEWLSSGHSIMQVWLLKCCRKGWLPVSIDQHWCSVKANIGSLSQSLMFARRLFKKSQWFPFTAEDLWSPLCSLGLSMLQEFFCTFPRSVPQYCSISEVCRQFLGLHGLVWV